MIVFIQEKPSYTLCQKRGLVRCKKSMICPGGHIVHSCTLRLYKETSNCWTLPSRTVRHWSVGGTWLAALSSAPGAFKKCQIWHWKSFFCQQHRHQKELEFGRQQIGKFINKVPNKAVHNKCAIRGPCVDLRMHMEMIPLSFARCCRSSWAVWRGSFGILTQPDFLSIHFTDTATPNWIKSKSWKPGFYLTTKIEEKIISIYSRFHHFSHLEVVFATDHPGACQEETHMLMTQLRGEIAAELRQMHRQELNNFSLQKLGRDWLEQPIG